MRVTGAILAIVLLVLLRGCWRPGAGPVDDAPHRPASPPVEAPIPSEEPSIRGVVTAAGDGRLRVEENPGEASGSPKAIVRLTPSTAVRHRSGGPVAPGEITVGHNVSVWFTGPVAESYPVQATAALIVIEPVPLP